MITTLKNTGRRLAVGSAIASLAVLGSLGVSAGGASAATPGIMDGPPAAPAPIPGAPMPNPNPYEIPIPVPIPGGGG
jgi:hypothetical protein